MSHTNSTSNYNLPQFVGTDKPAWLGDINPAMSAIDTAIKSASDAATTADGKAETAQTDVSGLSETVTSLGETVSTQGTQISNNTSSINTLNTNVTNLNNSIIAEENKFILNNITTSNVTPTGTTLNNLTLAQNSDGSVFKIYGSLQGTNISWTRQAIQGYAGHYGIPTGLYLINAPSEAFTITCALFCVTQNTNNYTNAENLRPLDLAIGTDGQIYLWAWTTSQTSTSAANIAVRLWLPPCVYFNSNFGDQPQE